MELCELTSSNGKIVAVVVVVVVCFCWWVLFFVVVVVVSALCCGCEKHRELLDLIDYYEGLNIQPSSQGKENSSHSITQLH